ncbi:hypothetical protein [Streptomyces shenzhenensis]|uniref:hypothetical protein n=1 Tax=Streptomyces shenzhenensis TaxID=943815 RepID=UPI001604CDD2|nr:hypothetical protein [Streptomyces shenzhenensis]
MSRNEQTGSPITEGDGYGTTAPGKVSKLTHRFTVVISGDGSATIDGRPVPAEEGAEADAAVLDALHQHARERDTAVTASISDPAAGYVAYVEVAPDGSSRLLEHAEQYEEEYAGEPVSFEKGDGDDAGHGGGPHPPSAAEVPPVPEPEASEPEEPAQAPEPAEAEVAESAYALPEPVGLSPTPRAPVLHRTPDSGPGRPNRRNESRQSDDEYTSPGLLNRPLIIGPVALLVAALVIIPLVILGSGGSGDDDRRSQAAKVNSTPQETTAPAEPPAPTVSVTPSLSPSPSPSASASKSGKPGGKGGVAVPPPTVTVTANAPRVVTTVTARPAQDTAATAVRRLAANDPSGRHICYRAYVAGQGWQKPVCDGTIAGTSGKNKAIKALNISVSGTDGSAANAVLHNDDSANDQGSWQPAWTSITDDGKDFYIGNPKRSGPYMTGFAINVGTGQICREAAVHDRGWGDHQCVNQRPEFIFGGTMDNTPYLEAVKLTV